MDLQDVVNANQHRFSGTEREILAFMLDNEKFVAEATISSLAHKTYTSTSSIIRLTKKLNFSGFAELKYFIKSSLTRTEPYNPRFIESGKEDILRTYDYLEHMELSKLIEKCTTPAPSTASAPGTPNATPCKSLPNPCRCAANSVTLSQPATSLRAP